MKRETAKDSAETQNRRLCRLPLTPFEGRPAGRTFEKRVNISNSGQLPTAKHIGHKLTVCGYPGGFNMSNSKDIFYPSIPKRELEALARCLLPTIQEYFESEEGKREFAEWEAQQKD